MQTREARAALVLPESETKRTGRMLKRLLLDPKLWSIIVVALAWQIASFFTPPRILPPPMRVSDYLWDLLVTGEAFYHLGRSLVRIIGGFSISMILGTAIGVIMGLKRYWESFIGVYVSIGLTMPSITWALLGVMWLGLSEMTLMFAAFMITFPYVSINVWEGVKSVSKELVDMGASFRKTRSQIVRQIIFPSLVPFLFAGMRYGFAVCWKVVIFAEMFVADVGVGYMIFLAYERFSITALLAWVILFIFLMLVLEFGVFRVVEKKFLAWRPELVLR